MSLAGRSRSIRLGCSYGCLTPACPFFLPEVFEKGQLRRTFKQGLWPLRSRCAVVHIILDYTLEKGLSSCSNASQSASTSLPPFWNPFNTPILPQHPFCSSYIGKGPA